MRPTTGPVVVARPGAGDGRFDPAGRYRKNKDGSDRPHRGIDYSAPIGTEVSAAADGVVVISGGGYRDAGDQIVIRTADGFEPAYFHLSERRVMPGDVVRKGQVIGRTGTSGNAQGTTSPHLHFQVRDPQGRLIDPGQWIEDGVHLPGGAPWDRHGAGAKRPIVNW